jgi:hypothetical protein
VITKALVSAVIALGVGVVVAAPAAADPYACSPAVPNPSAFCGLSQSASPKAGLAIPPNQLTQGIQQGLSDLQATQGQP